MKNPKLIILVGPSGAGKSTISKYLLETLKESLLLSVSATTREKRNYEVEGAHYHFLSHDDFLQKIREGCFVEHEEVYEGIFYGTLFSEVERILTSGKYPVFDIDVYGALALKKKYNKNALAIFIAPPSLLSLKERLSKRETETSESLKKRLERALFEMRYELVFDEVVVNSNLQEAEKQALKFVQDFLAN